MKLTGRKIGNIRIEALLGKGGMGRVYRGFDEKLHRPVAVKTLRRRTAFSGEARARFLREARVLSQLNHPNICQVYDLIEGPDADFLILELVEGRHLSELSRDSLSLDEKLRIGEAVMEAVAAAHREQIVHRDLKPDNIMITPDGRVKVLDFGIARPVWSFGEETPEEGSEVLPPVAGPVPGPPGLPAAPRDPDRTQALRPPSDPDLGGRAPTSGAGGSATGADATGVDAAGVDARGAGAPGAPETLDAAPLTAGGGTLATGDSFLTSDRAAVGTPAYMSPEQARSEPLTVASDLYSFGILFQELLTGRRAWPEVSAEELMERVRRGRTESPRGLDPELALLLRDLKSPEPADRPTAVATRDRLRVLRARPERRRRRRWAAALVLLLAVAAAGFAWQARHQARRQAEIAQRFTEEAYEVESFLRQAYLAPVHNLDPTLERARRRMADLQAQMEELGGTGGGPGEYALGRIALALEDYDEARRHLEAAWESGYRPPQVASGLGLATFELYRQERARLDAQGDSTVRTEALARLDSSLRQPSLTYLARGREALAAATEGGAEALAPESYRGPADAPDYLEALQAFHEERYDDALARARATVEKAPLFFESYLLLGKIYRLRLEELEERGGYTAAVEAYGHAREALRQAADVGRSHPGTYLGICELARSRLVLEIYQSPAPVFDLYLEDGRTACRTVLQIDPDNTRARLLMAQLGMREAEGKGRSEASVRALREAADWVRQAVEIGGETAEGAKTLGHIYMVEADWLVYARKGDPAAAQPIVAAATVAYERARSLSPQDPSILNALANSYSLAATTAIELGEDPRGNPEASIAIYRQAAELSPESPAPLANMILILADQARFAVETGGDPTAAVLEAEATFARVTALNPNYHNGYFALAEVLRQSALYEELHGHDPTPFFDRARKLCQQVVEVSPGRFYEQRCLVILGVDQAGYEVRTGADPLPTVAMARALLLRLRESMEDEDLALIEEGALARIEAEHLLATGQGAGPALAHATRVLDRALELQQEQPRAILERVRVALVAGRWSEAEEILRAGLELRPRGVPLHLAGAELAWRQGGRALARGADLTPYLARGREHLARIAEIHQDLAEAEAFAGVLDRLEARSIPPGPGRRALLAAAARRLESALAKNAHLHHRFGPELARVRRGAGGGA